MGSQGVPTRTMPLGTGLPGFGWVFIDPFRPPPVCSWCGRPLIDYRGAGCSGQHVVICPTCDGWGAMP